ncbi:MAG: hypothetical protein ACNYZH_06435 [Acidimicrobiia bacterium]
MSQTDETWTDVGEQFKKLGSILKCHYQAQEGTEGAEVASEDEVKDAVRALGETIKAAIATVGDTIKDPEVRDEARETAASFFDALGATFSDLADDISKRSERGDSLDPPSTEDASGRDAFEEEE